MCIFVCIKLNLSEVAMSRGLYCNQNVLNVHHIVKIKKPIYKCINIAAPEVSCEQKIKLQVG